MEILEFISSVFLGPGLSLAVFGCGVALTLELKLFGSPRKFLSAFRKENGGGVSPAKAMCVALAGTLGVGNIAGVASAISIGGDGAVFWMLISSVFAMAIKYAETVAAIKHRRKGRDGYHGGAFFVMADQKIGSRRAALIFAILCVISSFTIGSSIQSDAAASCLESGLGIDRKLCGVIFGVAAFFVVSGGFSRISGFTSFAVPTASIGVVLISSYIIITNIGLVPSVCANVISDALGKKAFSGGIIGFLTSRTLSIGVTRGIVSNEAGCGTAPIAHSSSSTVEPAVQGIWGMLEVFIDTPILCTMTALVLLIAKERGAALSADGMESALLAYRRFVPFSGVMLSAAVTIFAFATMICWFYYGSESLKFICGGSDYKPVIRIYAVAYSAAVGLGAFVNGGILWSLSDLSISAMTIMNLFSVMRALPEIKSETERYFRRGGKMKPLSETSSEKRKKLRNLY